MKSSFGKLVNFDRVFLFIIIVFIFSLGVTIFNRGGRDLRVALFGVEQVLQRSSPYENPTDPHRTIFRYAPGLAILAFPFLLMSRMYAPFEFHCLSPSIFAWYLAGLLSLLVSAWALFKIIPAANQKLSSRNLRIAFLVSLPFIGYELSNSQNKLIALCFMLLAIFFFERDKFLAAGLLYSFSLTIYIPLISFLFYFVLRKRRFVFSFLLGAFAVFFLIPSLIWGFNFNNSLLKDWFEFSLKPFFLTDSYASYIDLRPSSQSLPSTMGRLFVSGRTGSFKYLIDPLFIHIMIKVFSFLLLIFSLLAVRKGAQDKQRGLEYSVFFILAMLLPQYCIYYTWSWAFVFCFAVLNYISYPEISAGEKRSMLILLFICFASFSLMCLRAAGHLSVISWGTLLLWLGLVTALISRPGALIK